MEEACVAQGLPEGERDDKQKEEEVEGRGEGEPTGRRRGKGASSNIMWLPAASDVTGFKWGQRREETGRERGRTRGRGGEDDGFINTLKHMFCLICVLEER